jgi:PAS domain S-box-containing protein
MSLLALPHDGSHLTTWYDITQRKAMETLLADREQHLELALAGAAMGTWEWVVPSGELRFSARWAALQGYTLEELPRRIESWATRVFPDDLPLVRERLDRHLKGETPDYESEHRLLHKNGHWVWVLARGKVVERDGAGEPVRVMGITFDITERKQTEAQLETLLREQRAILDSPVVGIVKVKARVIVWANAAFARMLGYSPEELIGQPTRIAYPNDESYEAFGQLVYPILARGEVLRTELQQRRKDGTLGWYEIGTGRLGLENGEALGAFVDISQRKSAELALRASEERLRIIFQSMAEGLVLQCRDGRIVDANPAAEALLGLGREQLLGKTSVDPQWCAIREDGTPFPGDEHPGMVTLRTGKSLRHQIMGIKAPGHGLRWISINSQPVFADEQGLPVQVIATFVDVTERRLAEAEILSTKNQLQATLDAIPDVLFEVGVDGRIHSYHSQRSDPMETSTNGFVGKTLFAVLPADAAEVCIDAIRVAVDKGGSTGHAYRLSLPQGERWFELSAAPMAAAAGQVQRIIVLSRDITERKRLEAQLLASALEIEDLYDHAPCGYHSVGPDGIYLQINATELAWLGYRRDEVVGRMTPADFLTPTGRTLFEQMFPSLKNEGQVKNLEFELVARNGSRRQVSISATSVRDADGSFLMSRSVMFDITELKALQSRMQQLLIEQQALLDNGLVGIMTASDRTIVWANRALEDMFGYERGELAGSSTQTGYPSAQAYADFGAAAYPVLQAGGVFRAQVEYVRKDGVPIWMDVSGARLESHAGDSLWCFVDITERVRQEHQLEAQRWHLQNIVDGTRAGTWEWNVETGECVANELLAQMAGYTLQELAPLSIRTWERLIHPDDRELSARLLDGYLAGELPYYEYEGRVHHKDGHWVWVLVRGKVSQWSTDGRPLLLSGTHQDISAQKQNEAMLEAARLQAEAASVAKSRFLATMSHEIRTPMHAILGMAQMLQVPGLDERRRQDYARTVLNSGQALLALLNDILDTSKIEAGSIELESVALRPREILDDTQMLFSEAIHQKGLRFASEWSGPAAQRYLGDPYRLRQMLANLLGNAVKFTEQGRIQLAARELERDATTAVLEFSVSDTGIGIPQDKQQDLFLPFAQADTSTTRQYGGTGLGLSIVSSLAKQMHGEVGVESEVGRGSRFWFRLRARLPAAGGDGPVEARYEPSPLAARPTQMLGRVLVVDDSRSSRKVIEAMLNTLGLSVVMAENGQQAVDACLRGEAADLVLMDLHMPVMDGYDAAVRIRRWEVESAQPRHPIIALTADVKDENRQRCLAVDMDDFLCKPLVVDTLAATLGKYLPSAATASQIPAPRAVDPLRIAALLGELEVLLVEGKFDAVGCFRSLQEAVAGTELAAELTETGRLLAEVRFDLALGELRRVAAAQGWRNKT